MSAEKTCRVMLYNAPDCADWLETVWAIDLGERDGKHIVSLRNHPVGASFDPTCPAWGDEIEVSPRDGWEFAYDLQNGTIVKRYEKVDT